MNCLAEYKTLVHRTGYELNLVKRWEKKEIQRYNYNN